MKTIRALSLIAGLASACTGQQIFAQVGEPEPTIFWSHGDINDTHKASLAYPQYGVSFDVLQGGVRYMKIQGEVVHHHDTINVIFGTPHNTSETASVTYYFSFIDLPSDYMVVDSGDLTIPVPGHTPFTGWTSFSSQTASSSLNVPVAREVPD